MGTHLVGLDIGTSAIRAAEIKHSRGKGDSFQRFAERILPPGVLDHGELREPETLTAELKRMWKQARFHTKHVALAVNGPGITVRTVELEQADTSDGLEEVIQDMIPMSSDEAIVDYLALEDFIGADGVGMTRFLVVAAPAPEVEQIVEAVLAAGLIPDRVDLAPIAAARAVAVETASVDERGSEVIVDLGASMTSIVVTHDGGPRLVRILPGGGDDLTEALMAELDCDTAEAFMRKSAVDMPSQSYPPESSGATGVMERHLGKTIEEIVRSIDYYRQTADAATPTRCLLVGGGARVRGLRERLEHDLGIPVVHGDPFARFGAVPVPEEERDQIAHTAAVAIGLAVE
ncbi:MAG: type IV pilus assembly protein PilM [Actinomycetota bacterium]